jgi:hypothetical protein
MEEEEKTGELQPVPDGQAPPIENPDPPVEDCQMPLDLLRERTEYLE